MLHSRARQQADASAPLRLRLRSCLSLKVQFTYVALYSEAVAIYFRAYGGCYRNSSSLIENERAGRNSFHFDFITAQDASIGIAVVSGRIVPFFACNA